MRCRHAELARLVSYLEDAAHGLLPNAGQYVTSWSPPEDVERWYTAEALAKHQDDLLRLRAAIEDAFGVELGG
jgi:hypothetical protein